MAPAPIPETKTGIALFLGLAFSGSILLSLFVGLTGGSTSPLLRLAPLTMFVPALAVLAVRKTTSAPLGIDGMHLPLRWLPPALFILPLAIHTIGLPGVFFLEGKLPWVSVSWPRVVVNAIFGLLVVSFLAFFEEIGWRAFLLPRLANRFGMRRAAVLSAATWALWHIPYSLSGILHVENVSRLGLALSIHSGPSARVCSWPFFGFGPAVCRSSRWRMALSTIGANSHSNI